MGDDHGQEKNGTSNRNTQYAEPFFVARLRTTVDIAARRNQPRLHWRHSYRSRSGPRWVVNGWSSRITRASDPRRALEIWFDNLDNDLTVHGDRLYREWPADSLETEEGQRECLAEIDRLIDEFAAHSSRSTAGRRTVAAAVLVAVAVVAAWAVSRRSRRPWRL